MEWLRRYLRHHDSTEYALLREFFFPPGVYFLSVISLQLMRHGTGTPATHAKIVRVVRLIIETGGVTGNFHTILPLAILEADFGLFQPSLLSFIYVYISPTARLSSYQDSVSQSCMRTRCWSSSTTE